MKAMPDSPTPSEIAAWREEAEKHIARWGDASALSATYLHILALGDALTQAVRERDFAMRPDVTMIAAKTGEGICVVRDSANEETGGMYRGPTPLDALRDALAGEGR
jgi:hypothetical protein